jgi:phosphate/sulfate permease
MNIMEYFYMVIVGLLFLFAISDLIVGVSNDAVNFLNSAIGAKAAKFKFLMLIASAGVLVGSLFSGGMMEVARSGIFHPTQFYFHEIMLLFLAVMITDVLLLDFFNTLGLPTSTTVSLVFELLGAAFVLSIIKIIQNGETMMVLSKYINSEKALAIISAIFISIAIAFTIGFIVMFLSRVLFTFFYEKKLKILGSIFGGISISIISYFIFIKGLKDVSFVPEYILIWINSNILLLIGGISLSITALFFLIQLFAKVNIFRIVVFFGTFALAMAFAGNDLVNFIGIPMAGYKSFEIFMSSGSTEPTLFTMEMLAQPVKTEIGFLIIAGIIMILALWFSKKARTVVETSVNLSRQKDGNEQFGANPLSRAVVRFFYNLGSFFSGRYARRISNSIDNRFIQPPINKKDPHPPAFDMLRASMNLMVASSLIALGTSLKLPLSTTYVTFMVAMGTSLADRAWGRESAVYRVSGVFTVIGGWFLTAFVAFSVSSIIALILWWGDMIAIAIIVPLVIFTLIRTHRIHKKQSSDKKTKSDLTEVLKTKMKSQNQVASAAIADIVNTLPDILKGVHNGLKDEDLKMLKLMVRKSKALDQQSEAYKNAINEVIKDTEGLQMKWTEHMLKMSESLRGIVVSLSFISKPAYQHVSNIHKSLNKNQLEDFKMLIEHILVLNSFVMDYIQKSEVENGVKIKKEHEKILGDIDKIRIKQIERIKRKETPSRSSLLFLNIVSELRLISFLLVDLYVYETKRLQEKEKEKEKEKEEEM